MTRVEREAVENLKTDLGNLLVDLSELRGVPAFVEALGLSGKLQAKIESAIAVVERKRAS